MTETELQTEVITIAKRLGWLWFHVPGAHSRRTKPGFPDLVLLHPRTGQLLFVELKAAKGKVSDEQAQWIDGLTYGGHIALVWRPDDLAAGRVADWLTPERAVA